MKLLHGPAGIIVVFCIGWISGTIQGKSVHSQQKMKKVTSIGGIFFKCRNPAAIRQWYAEHLGFDTDQYGTNFEWRRADDSCRKGFTLWGTFNQHTKYFSPSEKDFMINYRVENLALLVGELKKQNVKILDTIQTVEYGKFIHIMDIEENKIELWEPNDITYDKLVEGRTK